MQNRAVASARTVERSTYVLCSSLTLLLLFWQWRPLGMPIWTVENDAARIVLWTLFAAGWSTVLIVTFLINHFDLFGLRAGGGGARRGAAGRTGRSRFARRCRIDSCGIRSTSAFCSRSG